MIRFVTLTVLAIALAGAAPAFGEVPTATAKVGEPFTYSGLVYGQPAAATDTPFYVSDGDHDECTLSDGVILWEPQVAEPGAVSLVPIQGGWNVTASGTHTFKRKIAVGAVDFTLNCNGNVQRHTYRDWVRITVTGEAESCPAGQMASISQAGCPNTYFGSDEKFLFGKLAKIAYDGFLVDQAINDFIELPEQGIKGKFKDIAVVEWLAGKTSGKALDKLLARLPKAKFIPYGEILDAAEYASYLDLAKYTVLTRLANDPPDPDFAKLASPTKLRELSRAPWLGSLDRREVGLYIALLTTVERAGGAQAASDAAAESRQLRHASDLANELVSLLGARERALRKTVARFDGLPERPRLSRAGVRAALRSIESRSFRNQARKVLGELGFNRQELQQVAADAPDVGVGHFTRPFSKVLGLDTQAKLLRAERAALARFASRHALAGG